MSETVERKRKLGLLIALMPLVYLVMAAGVTMVVSRSGVYPAGVDTLCHIYKAQELYSAIQRGNWWPVYDPLWYNGVEVARYGSPLPTYLLALCQWLGGGDPMDGYLLFIFLLYLAYSMGWFYVGAKLDRPWLGAFLGGLWFFLPSNLVTLFVEGDLPQALCVALLPPLLIQMVEYQRERRWRYLTNITFLFALVCLCHFGYGGLILLAFLLLALFEKIFVRERGKIAPIAIAMALGGPLAGVFVLPALLGGLASGGGAEVMAGFFQSLRITLDPLYRLEHGATDFYFGAAAMLLAVFGAIAAPRKAIPGFLTAAVIVLLTSSSAYAALVHVPGGQYLWMLRLLPVALALALFSFLLWRRPRLPLTLLFCALLVADAIPSQSLIYGNRSGASAASVMEDYAEWTMTEEAKVVTTQRLALLDEGVLDSMSAYLITGYGDQVAAAYGAAWRSSAILSNLKQLDRSLEEGDYLYLFDRCVELGSDTVLVRLAVVKDLANAPVERMDEAAAQVGYALAGENEAYRLYHLDTPERWGVVSQFSAIGIGDTAAGMALSFPAMEETTSTNLNDYTYEELSQYQMVYLSGFTYDDRDQAEELVLQLSRAGTRVVICADGVPEDRSTRDQSFLGVLCNPITFNNGYPEMDTIDGTILADLFPAGYTNWRTVYVDGLDETWGTLYDNGLELDFYGTVDNENLVFIGANLGYFYELTQDPAIGDLLAHAMRTSGDLLPQRTIIPLEVSVSDWEITVTSPEDGVNSTLAFHESFDSDQPLVAKNNLAVVGAGTTRIRLTYPYLLPGALISLGALLLTALYAVWERRQILLEKAEIAREEALEAAEEAARQEAREREAAQEAGEGP